MLFRHIAQTRLSEPFSEATARISGRKPIVQFFLLKVKWPIAIYFFPKISIPHTKPLKGPSMNMAGRPSNRVIVGNFFLKLRPVFRDSIFSLNGGKTSFSSDQAPLFYISRNDVIWHIYLSYPTLRTSLFSTTFIGTGQEQKRTGLAAARNTKTAVSWLWKFQLVLEPWWALLKSKINEWDFLRLRENRGK